MPALCTARADDVNPRGSGSASEAHCPARLGPGGAFLSMVFFVNHWRFHLTKEMPELLSQSPSCLLLGERTLRLGIRAAAAPSRRTLALGYLARSKAPWRDVAAPYRELSIGGDPFRGRVCGHTQPQKLAP